MDSKSIGLIRRFECSLSAEEIASIQNRILIECINGKVNDYPIEYQGMIETLKVAGALRSGLTYDESYTNCSETLKTTVHDRLFRDA